MVVQVLLQVCKSTFYLVVRVWHSFTFWQLIGMQIRQVIIQTVHRRSKPTMEIVRLAVFVDGASIQEVVIYAFPLRVFVHKILFVQIDHIIHK